MTHSAFQFISFAAPFAKITLYCGVIDAAMLNIGQQVLLANICIIAAVRVFGKQVVKRLIFCRTHGFGNGLIPFLAVGKYGVNIKDNAAKFKYPVTYNVAYIKLGFCDNGGCGGIIHAAYIARLGRQINLALGKA